MSATELPACEIEITNPVAPYLRQERLPHIWCPGCGIGTTVNCFTRALTDSGLDLDRVAIVSGIGCTGRVAGYMNLDSFHTTHGRAIPFATGLRLGNPDLAKVVVYSGDGDLSAIGGNHLIHAARRNMDLMVVCVNNFTYGMTGGQVAPTTPIGATQTTMPYGNFENPFNLPFLADACGAVYVARWTVYHVKQLAKAMLEGLKKKGFVFIEAMAPCPTLYSRRNRLGDGVDQLKYYKEKSKVVNGANTQDVGLTFQGDIVVGKFVDRERPTWLEAMNAHYTQHFGDKYTPYGGPHAQE
ncbi:MAG: 2-oxoacid:ferredoxin oxidoreductase subunit beta [Thermoanaerobaculaceae bacterium]|nr:2-oxoacid:ferredoxin oxidoreductase subunit beta [Thermoanaerobaculaceae bacterium]TAM50039.1 MAG: 2-oxoacid:ferredoxin oxidoreductase subunit beta [Acidobacteriota bacterium]